MSDTVAMALIAAAVTIATTAASTILIWLKAGEAVQAGRDARAAAETNIDQTAAVHTLVNSQKALLVAEIVALKAQVAKLTAPVLPPPVPPNPGA